MVATQTTDALRLGSRKEERVKKISPVFIPANYFPAKKWLELTDCACADYTVTRGRDN